MAKGHRVEVWDEDLAWCWCVMDARYQGRKPAIARGIAPDAITARECGEAVSQLLKDSQQKGLENG